MEIWLYDPDRTTSVDGGIIVTISSVEDDKALTRAVQLLEFPSLSDKLGQALGKPAEKAMALLPEKVQMKLVQAVDTAIRKAFEWVLLTMNTSAETTKSYDKTHKILAASTGFAGGFFGGWGLIAEIPVTTGLMLRSIADIARSEGEDLSDVSARLACVQVLALDTRHSDLNRVGIGSYFAVRNAMSTMVVEAVTHLAGSVAPGVAAQMATQTISETAATVVSAIGAEDLTPAIVKLMSTVASRYGVVVTEETALQWLPIIGGLGGAAISYLFTDHFQNIAHGHFTVRRLERKYGPEDTQLEYEARRQQLFMQRVSTRARLHG